MASLKTSLPFVIAFGYRQRAGIMRHISELIVRMAQENPGWGYTRIQGALANLSHKVEPTSQEKSARFTACLIL